LEAAMSVEVVTDCYISMRLYSQVVTAEAMERELAVAPTDGAERQPALKNSRGVLLPPKPARWKFDTEELVSSRDLNDRFAHLAGVFVDMAPLHRLPPDPRVTALIVAYWWTTESLPFELSPAALGFLARVGLPCHFHVAVYDD
jgi:hypothetical protein